MLQTIKENKLIRLRRLLAVTLCALFTFALFGTMTEETFAASLSKPSITSISADTSKVTVKWKKVKNVTGYQIQYATNKKFTQNKKTVKISKASTVKKTISGLKSGKKYYVRVRCYKNGKKTTYSKWSKVKSVTTKKKASLSSSSKINVTATSKPNGFRITWNPISDDLMYYDSHSVKYQIQYKTGSGSWKTKTLKCSNMQTYSSYNVTMNDKKETLSSGTYQVRMRAVIDGKNKAWSDTKTVSVVNYMKDLEAYAS